MSTFSSPVMRAAWYGASGQITPEQAGASLQPQAAAVVGAAPAAAAASNTRQASINRAVMGGGGTGLSGNPTGAVLG